MSRFPGAGPGAGLPSPQCWGRRDGRCPGHGVQLLEPKRPHGSQRGSLGPLGAAVSAFTSGFEERGLGLSSGRGLCSTQAFAP